jgi:hypothetical protein
MFFGRQGLAVDYEDASGNFTFVFDLDPIDPGGKGEKEKLLISRWPLKNMKLWWSKEQVDRDHVVIMLKRVREYLRSLGYECRVDERQGIGEDQGESER